LYASTTYSVAGFLLAVETERRFATRRETRALRRDISAGNEREVIFLCERD
jgi:hypothetical protein